MKNPLGAKPKSTSSSTQSNDVASAFLQNSTSLPDVATLGADAFAATVAAADEVWEAHTSQSREYADDGAEPAMGLLPGGRGGAPRSVGL